MRLPDFLIIGAQKSGTTWLKEQLRHHPGIFMPEREVHFFDHAGHFSLGPEWYARQFAAAQEEDLLGEKTPNYLYISKHPDVPNGVRRIHDLLPGAKLIVILRDPVQRALSALNHLAHKQRISPLDSAESLLLGRKRSRLPWPVIDMGIYHHQIRAYLERYDRDAMMILFYEEISENPRTATARVFEFLGVPVELRREQLRRRPNRPRASRLGLIIEYYAPSLAPLVKPWERRLGEYYPRLGDRARSALYRFYEPHNEALFELIGRRPATGWQPR